MRGDKAVACGLVAVCAAETGAEVAPRKVRVGEILLLGGGFSRESLVSRNVRVVEKEGRGKMEAAASLVRQNLSLAAEAR